MKKQFSEKIEIPQGTICDYKGGALTCKRESIELSRKIKIPRVTLNVENNIIIFNAPKANKNEIKTIKSYIAHIKNMFKGLESEYIYNLEAVNVHFPMDLKIEGNSLIIKNFLGETIPRKAKILPNVKVDLKGPKIKITSNEKEAAGQTAGNFEKATKVKGRDRRIFQDGIFLTSKPGDKKWQEKHFSEEIA